MLFAKHTGMIHVFSNVKVVSKIITVKNIFYVPDLLNNLFSMGRIEEKGMKVTFYSVEVLIHPRENILFLKKRE